MDSDEKLSVLWLAMAMTVPESCKEHFYYDSQSKQFFSIKSSPKQLELFDRMNNLLPTEIGSDITVRLEWVNDESSEIVEIPRLNVADKVAIQLLFLSNFEGVMHLQELITAVENQRDDYKMVLDTLLIENCNTTAITSYWNNFKLKTLSQHINHFAAVIGTPIHITDNLD